MTKIWLEFDDGRTALMEGKDKEELADAINAVARQEMDKDKKAGLGLIILASFIVWIGVTIAAGAGWGLASWGACLVLAGHGAAR
jgi:hypothetical protein